MSNVHEVNIKGLVPYDISHKAEAIKWMAGFSSPTWGLKISYFETKTGPENGMGGHMTYYRFEVSGQEAISSVLMEMMCDDLVLAGAVITEARQRDIENHGRWYNIKESFPLGEMR
jgi:hypothetical protein